ncbi:hypothetical protein QMN58_24550, partial [Escherichia coli]|nr:hypothetical protein [Escherichia coli]
TSRTLKPTQELSRQTLLSQADAGCLDFEQYTAGFSMYRLVRRVREPQGKLGVAPHRERQ